MNSMDIDKVKEHFNDRKDDCLTQQVNISIHFFRRSFSFLVANSRWYRLLRRNIRWNFDMLSKCDPLSFGWWSSFTFANFLRFNINKSNFNSSSFIIIIVNSSRFENHQLNNNTHELEVFFSIVSRRSVIFAIQINGSPLFSIRIIVKMISSLLNMLLFFVLEIIVNNVFFVNLYEWRMVILTCTNVSFRLFVQMKSLVYNLSLIILSMMFHHGHSFSIHCERVILISLNTWLKNPSKIFSTIFDWSFVCLFVCFLFSWPHVQVLFESYQSKEGSNSAANVSTLSTNNTRSLNLRNIEYNLVGNPHKRWFVS